MGVGAGIGVGGVTTGSCGDGVAVARGGVGVEAGIGVGGVMTGSCGDGVAVARGGVGTITGGGEKESDESSGGTSIRLPGMHHGVVRVSGSFQ